MTAIATLPTQVRTTATLTPEKQAVDRSMRSVNSATRDFDSFYRAHRDEVGRALAFTFRDRSLGEEAVDEAMARAYQQWGTLASTSNPAGWVYVAGRRWGLSWLRSRRRERRRESCLTVDQRTVVVCRFSLGLSVTETAELLGVREGTVKSRLSRSIEKLRDATEVRR